jgi:shikimate dehydrogenase
MGSADLRSPESGGERWLSGNARTAAVIGWPVSHSLSPRLHGFWLRQHAIDGAYIPLAVRPDHLVAAVRALPLLGLAGANITVPHKQAAMAVMHQCSDAARRIGAINTIVVGEDGRLHGDNTDAFGFLAHLQASVPAWRAARGAVAVIGSGGAARAVVHALLSAGVPEVRVAGRSGSRVQPLVDDLGPGVVPVAWPDRARALQGVTLLVNATTQGMAGQPPLDLGLHHLPAEALVYDLVYQPLETPLLRAAAARGHRTIDGLGMLLHQARPGFAAWFGVMPEVTQALQAVMLDACARRP